MSRNPLAATFALVILAALWPQAAHADDIHPAIYVLVDTSGSMLESPAGVPTYGDGSVEHPHAGAEVSRLFMAKNAIATVVYGYGEVQWGLARFQQNEAQNYFCMCHDDPGNQTSAPCSGGNPGLIAEVNSGGTPVCEQCDMTSPYPDYDRPGVTDRVCINYAGGIYAGCTDPHTSAVLDGADILVALAEDNENQILAWIDHAETDFAGGTDKELRAVGGTPIGGSLTDLYTQLANTDIGTDSLRGCRPYSIIVLTDGAESCNTDPASAATALRTTPDNQNNCSNCPPNTTCVGNRCRYDVKTYVIGFALDPIQFYQASQISMAGGTGPAIEAWDENDIAAAMAQIIADSFVPELCNDVDDDCDNDVDEDFPEKGLACDDGQLGVCRGTGVYVCRADGTGVQCNITNPGQGASSEICDGLDNDCNGLVDDVPGGCQPPPPELCNGVDDDSDPGTPDGADDPAVGQPCGNDLGICQAGVTICQGGVVICNQPNGPQTEICDGLDNNCDGVVDGLSAVCYTGATGCVDNGGVWTCQGACQTGVTTCPPSGTGTWSACLGEVTPTAEICDGVDNNCDGAIDENLVQDCYPPGSGTGTGCALSGGVWTCQGECQVGQRVCTGGAWAQCAGHVTPTVEICDLLDNDCNGQVDDNIPGLGQPCSNALGRCTPGILQCQNGVEICDGGAGPFEGECNGLDDDCDGEIDEPDEVSDEEGLPCGNSEGMCEPGTTRCVGGAIICEGGVQPAPEACDGLDNNCDGLTDNEAECPPQWWCVAASCRQECDPSQEFPCQTGGMSCQEFDVEGTSHWICLPMEGVCGNVVCPDGQICVSDQCVDPCEGVSCDAWAVCTLGNCVDVSCTAPGESCPAGERCNASLHACEADPCADCAADEVCIDDVCQRDPCDDLSCDPVWEYCSRTQDGSDVEADCKPVCACAESQVCDADGQCIEDPCGGACVNGEVCDDGACVADPCFFATCADGLTCVMGACLADPCLLVECPSHTQCVAHDDGQGGASAVCEPRAGTWLPSDEGFTLTGTGGGATCATTNSSTGLVWLLLGLFALGWRRRRRPQRPRGAALPSALLALATGLCLTAAGCTLTTFEGSGNGTWVGLDGGGGDGEVTDDASTVSNDACVATEEVCDGLDNDCDGVPDNGFDLAQDPNNCGASGSVCELPFSLTHCADTDSDGLGECQFDGCIPGHHDNNSDPSDGCEYACVQTGGGTEICDGLDNDCNGVVDDPFDTQNDPNNCGSCGFVCVFFQGTGTCSGGLCTLDTCNAGYVDKDGNPNNGCECMVTNPVDDCDGVDSDCDGTVDEDSNVGGACYTSASGCTPDGGGGYNCVGACQAGQLACVGGLPGCQNEQGPVGELCNGQDDDCNGVVDDGFDLQNDIVNCGSCGNSCLASPTNTYPLGCSAGACLWACLPGYHDLNNDLGAGLAGNGCEYACSQTAPAGTEFCDGEDNDCDGQVDEPGDLQQPANLCNTTPGTPCANTTAACNGAAGWACSYVAGVEVDPSNTNRVRSVETLCDGFDGNCNGQVDENFSLGAACDDGNQGACRGTGTWQCAANQTSTECVITSPGGTAQAETCNGLDDDCDGLVDETAANPGSNPSYVQDDVVTVNVGGVSVDVYTFESSRPTSTAGGPGTGTGVRACSKQGVTPWYNVTYEQAAHACARAGMRLCATNEWFEACNGSGGSLQYPYGDAYQPSSCNGHDQNPATDAVEPTGTQSNCDSAGYGAEDLSGNLREWTNDLVGFTSAGKAIYRLRGGSFTDYSGGLACDFESTGFVEDAFAPNVGFRCCTTCGNGTVDPGETCDGGAGCHPLHCGPITCGNGTVDPGEQCDDGNLLPLDGCSPQCQREPENCSVLYPADEDNANGANCSDPACANTWCADVQDNDGDGFSEAQGDCDDANPNIHPAMPENCSNGIDDNCNGLTDMAETQDVDGDGSPVCHPNPALVDCDDNDPERTPLFAEVPGDGIDNNCNGQVDEAPNCDCSASNEAEAMDLCDAVSLSISYTGSANAHGYRVNNNYGAIDPNLGCGYAGLSSGPVWSTAPQTGTNLGAAAANPTGGPWNCFACTIPGGTTWEHMGPSGCCENETVNDVGTITFTIGVPMNVQGFSFDFIFLSAEYPEWVHTNYNDTFYAILNTSALPQTQNISFDINGQPLTVNNGWFETPPAWSQSIAGTGYDTTGSASGWLTTTSPCTPGETMTLTFWIHDEGDSIYDSAVVLDNWQWEFQPVSGPSTTK
ncbi:MAG: MopE-related protein [bacterium]